MWKTRESYIGNDGSKVDKKKKKIVIVEYGCALNGNISQKAKIFKIEEKGTK